MLDEISEAVLAREEVVKYLRGGYGEKGVRARDRIYAYLDELRTTRTSDVNCTDCKAATCAELVFAGHGLDCELVGCARAQALER